MICLDTSTSRHTIDASTSRVTSHHDADISTSWDDLPTDVTEIILAKVPFLRLAQMSHLCKDIHSAYRKRLAEKNEAPIWLQHVIIGDVPQNPFNALSRKVNMWNLPLYRLPSIGRQYAVVRGYAEHATLTPSWSIKSLVLTHNFRLFSCESRPWRVTGICNCFFQYFNPRRGFSVSAEVEWNHPIGRHRSISCKSVKFFLSSDWRRGDPPDHNPSLAVFLPVCTAMAGPLRTLLCKVAARYSHGKPGTRGHVASSDVHGKRGNGRSRSGHSCWFWPDAWLSVMRQKRRQCVMLLLASLGTIGGNPACARVGVRQDELHRPQETAWRLPCVIGPAGAP